MEEKFVFEEGAELSDKDAKESVDKMMLDWAKAQAKSRCLRSFLSDCFCKVEERGFFVDKMTISPKFYKLFREHMDEIDPVTSYELLKSGYVADLWGTQIHMDMRFGDYEVKFEGHKSEET